MSKHKILNIIFWIFLLAAIFFFGFGMRNPAQKVELTLLAMVLWALSYGSYKWMKHEKKKEENG